MAVYGADRVDLFVFTRRAGLLSAVGHDLKLRASELELKIEPDAGPEAGSAALSLRCNAASLRVVAALRDGREDPGALSPGDRAQIEANLRDDVLHVRRFPGISFDGASVRSSGAGRWHLGGPLLLHGVQRHIEADVEERAGVWRTEVRLHQPDFGIKPFSAMLGSLRVEPEVRVELRLRP